MINNLNTKSNIDRKLYVKQNNLCVSLIRWEKKKIFNNISTHNISDNKGSGTVKLSFTDKVQTESKIMLFEKKLFLDKWKSK